METCDDANQERADACRSCVLARCGDGVRRWISARVKTVTKPATTATKRRRTQILNTCVVAPAVTVKCAGVEACDDGNEVETDARNDCSSLPAVMAWCSGG